MNRIEELKTGFNEICNDINSTPETLKIFILCDIAKSLAVITDKMLTDSIYMGGATNGRNEEQ